MPKYNVIHNCGHAHECVVFGNKAERERKLDWLSSMDCPECRRKAEDDADARLSGAIAQENHASGAKPLVGSEKQIAWAEMLRYCGLLAMKAAVQRARANSKPEHVNFFFPFFEKTYAWLLENTDAKWWIDTLKDVLNYVNFLPQPPFIAGGELGKMTEPEVVRLLSVRSPHMNERMAGALNVMDRYRDYLHALEAAQAKAQEDAQKGQWAEEARSLGIAGRVTVWSKGIERRVYADQFEYYHAGRDAGKFVNKGKVDEATVRPFAKRLCEEWESMTIFP